MDGLKLPILRKGTYIWTPPPAAACVVLEELRKARHKRTESTHLFVVPRLMEPYWRKHLWKVSDMIASLPAGHEAWPSQMHEPLTIAFIFPFISHRPWQLRRTPAIMGMERRLSRVWKEDASSEGPLLRKFWNEARSLDRLSEELVRKLLRSESGFEVSDCNPRKR